MPTGRSIAALFCVTWFLGRSVPALAATTTVRGELKQRTDFGQTAPIPETRIRVTADNKKIADTFSGFDGKFYILNLPVGDYLLEISFSYNKSPSAFIFHASREPYTDLGVIVPDNDKLNRAMDDYILDVLKPFTKGVYRRGSIPAKKEGSCQGSTWAPKYEELLALIDITVTGTANDCLLFTKRGVFYHTDWPIKKPSPRRGFVRYQDFPGRNLKAKGTSIFFADDQEVDASGSDVRVHDLLTILKEVQSGVEEKLRQESGR